MSSYCHYKVSTRRFSHLTRTFAEELTLNGIDKTIHRKIWISFPERATSNHDSVFISIKKDPDGKNVWNESLKPDERK